MLQQSSPQMLKAVGVLKELSADERSRMLYEEREKARRDRQAYLDTAEHRGMVRGRNEGFVEVARNLLKIGRPIEEIIEVTGFTREEIQNLNLK